MSPSLLHTQITWLFSSQGAGSTDRSSLPLRPDTRLGGPPPAHQRPGIARLGSHRSGSVQRYGEQCELDPVLSHFSATQKLA